MMMMVMMMMMMMMMNMSVLSKNREVHIGIVAKQLHTYMNGLPVEVLLEHV
jgi:hypothetical protein